VAAADGAIHKAYYHEITQMPMRTRLRGVRGGSTERHRLKVHGGSGRGWPARYADDRSVALRHGPTLSGCLRNPGDETLGGLPPRIRRMTPSPSEPRVPRRKTPCGSWQGVAFATRLSAFRQSCTAPAPGSARAYCRTERGVLFRSPNRFRSCGASQSNPLIPKADCTRDHAMRSY